MKEIVLAAVFFATAGSLQAAGAVKTYLVESAFPSDETVDWVGAVPRDESANIAVNATKSVTIKVAMGSRQPPNLTSDERPNSDPNSGRFTITFTSGPVMAVGVRIQANGEGPFTDRLNAYDAAGNLVGTATVAGTIAPGMPSNGSPFLGIRSSLKEIAKVEIDSTGANGFTINGLKLGLRPIIENDWFFVNQQFQDLYGRAPSTAELMRYLKGLKEGTSTKAQVAATLFQSPEFHDNASFLVKCYLGLMQRDAEFGQWSQILKVIQGGATQNDAVSAFMSTPEYAAAYSQSLSDADFVAKAHRNLLGRDAAAGEVESWTVKLAHGTSRRDMVVGVLRSYEFEKRVASRVDTSLAYLAFLRQGGDAASLNRWIDALKSGASVADLIGALISLPEYGARF